MYQNCSFWLHFGWMNTTTGCLGGIIIFCLPTLCAKVLYGSKTSRIVKGESFLSSGFYIPRHFVCSDLLSNQSFWYTVTHKHSHGHILQDVDTYTLHSSPDWMVWTKVSPLTPVSPERLEMTPSNHGVRWRKFLYNWQSPTLTPFTLSVSLYLLFTRGSYFIILWQLTSTVRLPPR